MTVVLRSYVSPSIIVACSICVTPANADRKGDICKFGPVLKPDQDIAFRLHQANEIYRKADKKCNGTLDPVLLARYEAGLREEAVDFHRFLERRRAAGRIQKIEGTGDLEIPIPILGEPTSPVQAAFAPFLRDSYPDISIFSRLKDAKDASGASFGYARDGEALDNSWTAKGVAGFAYRWPNQVSSSPGVPYFVGFAVAPAVTFNVLTHSSSKLKSKQTDILSFNNTLEAAFGNMLNTTEYVRTRTALNTDFSGNLHSWSQTAELQPFSNDFPGLLSTPGSLGPYLTFEIDPIARLQYSERLDRNKPTAPLFVQHDQVLRGGGVVALVVKPVKIDQVLPSWVQNITLYMSYEYLADVSTGRGYNLLNSALIYNFDKDGHFGLKVSYDKGRLEENGVKVNQFKIGLAAKI